MNNRPKAIITGASSGIGRATATRFAADGYDVCLNARREQLLRQVADSGSACCGWRHAWGASLVFF
jgi:short-subunit dehydrogenase